MDESYEGDETVSPRPQAEGVRIIRAEEAQAALDAGYAAGRRPDDALRFGDVPPPPTGPRSPHRFPLPDSVDPASAVPRPAVRAPERRFGGRLTNRGKAAETVRAPSPPRVVRLLHPDTDDSTLGMAPPQHLADDGPGWGEDGGWSEDTVPRPPQPASIGVGASTSGPRHFAKGPDKSSAPEWPAASDPIGAPITPAFSVPDAGAPPPSRSGAPGAPGDASHPSGDASRPGGSDAYTASLDPPGRRFGYDPGAPPPVPPPLQPDLALPDEGINVHSGSMPALQHWTDPPTGEVPFIHADREPPPGEEMAAWQALGSRGLRWRDEASDWDDLDDVSDLGDDEAPLGALDTSRTEHSDVYSFDEQFDRLEDERSAPAPVLDPILDAPPASTGLSGGRAATRSREPVAPRVARRSEFGDGAPRSGVGNGVGVAGGGGGRDLRSATVVGVGMLVALCVAYALGSAVLMLLSAVVVTAAALELYNLIQHRGFRPATLLGVGATVAVMLAGYWKGEIAVPLILVLVFVTSMLWYMVGVVDARPVVNVGLTVMTFVWVGVLGSYGSLLLRIPHGKQLFLLPVLVTVAADVAAYFSGSTIGSRPLAPSISPGKTWEGVIGGGIGAIVVSFILSRLPMLSKSWSGTHALILGVVIAVVAPLGDLCESMVKRDLELKDSGSLLPGHGGLLDRFDAILFVLPATYYLLVYLKLG